MLAYANINKLNLTPKNISRRCFPISMINTFLDKDTGELMEYRRLIKNQKYCSLYRDSYAKDIDRLAQGMPGLADSAKKNLLSTKRSTCRLMARRHLQPNSSEL